jgi:uncharacterized membrane protein YphA (DoxX/SURF4 family)
MRFREKLALSFAPITLRVLVGVAFLWLGLGRLVDRIVVEGEDAAILAELGVVGAGMAGDAPAPGGQPAPGPVETRRLYRDALMIYNAANPRPGASGERPVSTWPGALAGGNAPVVLSWVGTSIALGGGVLVLLGFFTRFWGGMMILLMLILAWLTQIGPAVQSGETQIGVLPDRSLLDPAMNQELLWQFVLLMAAITLTLAGSGALAVDRMIFGKGGGKGGGGHG